MHFILLIEFQFLHFPLNGLLSPFVHFNFILAEIDWMRWDILLLFTLFIVFISLGSYGFGMSIRDKQKRKLEKLVKKRTDELESANAELKHRNSELDRFVYSASHDLSAPLKSIMGIINVARLEDPSSSQQKYLEMIEKSIIKLEGFIDEVIQYSRNARMPVQLEEVEFKPFVSGILSDYQFSPGFEKIKITINAPEEDKMITDTMRLKVILNNLISNAIKFHRTENGHVPEIQITFTNDEQYYHIAVMDNGRGIHSEYVDKIFEMFFRASEEVAGSGLGLYILRETITRLAGTIEVKSELGVGTEFRVTLPRV